MVAQVTTEAGTVRKVQLAILVEAKGRKAGQTDKEERLKMARSFVASDYAGVTSKNLDLYYGYESTDENGEWCFSARVGETEVMKIPQSKLKASDKFDCASCLLAGIGQLFDRYGIK